MYVFLSTFRLRLSADKGRLKMTKKHLENDIVAH